MSKSKTNTIAITMGDPSGIGPEVIVKALKIPSVRSLAPFVIIGDYRIFHKYCPLGLTGVSFINLKNVSPKKFILGKPNRHSATAALEYLETAVALLKQGSIRTLVTAPVCKEAITSLGVAFPGHTEFLADKFHIKKFEMLFVAPRMRVLVATRHIPLRQVSRVITTNSLATTILLAHQSLQKLFKIKKPKIALCGINPHAGEEGLMGNEEQKSVIPAIQRMRKHGIDVQGPFSADTLFYPANAGRFDIIIAMYHDQGLAPIKALYFDRLVNCTLGLPFVRTSPAHGTAFDLAGKNKANPGSMIEAIKLAAQLSR